jgi:CBS domain-containing protein
MQASDVMTSDVVSVGPDTPIPDIARLLVERRISGVPVVDSAGRLLGIVGEGNLIHLISRQGNEKHSGWLSLLTSPEEHAHEYLRSHGRVARDVMTTTVITIGESAPVPQVARLLDTRQLKRVPVVREGKVVGIITRSDLLRALAYRAVSSTTEPTDEEIRERLLANLDEAGLDWHPYVDIIVTNGVVHLWGTVDTSEEAEAFHLVAEATDGVDGVENHLAIRSKMRVDV